MIIISSVFFTLFFKELHFELQDQIKNPDFQRFDNFETPEFVKLSLAYKIIN